MPHHFDTEGFKQGQEQQVICPRPFLCSPIPPRQRLERIKRPDIYVPKTLSKKSHLIYYISQCDFILLSPLPFSTDFNVFNKTNTTVKKASNESNCICSNIGTFELIERASVTVSKVQKSLIVDQCAK